MIYNIIIIKFVHCTYLDRSHGMLKLKKETVISSCINRESLNSRPSAASPANHLYFVNYSL